MRPLLLAALLALAPLPAQAAGCAALLAESTTAADWRQCTKPLADQAIADVQVLADDAMQGRAPDTPGSARARAYLLERLQAIGVLPLFDTFEQPFAFRPDDGATELTGVNLVGQVAGTGNDGGLIVVTAHYDHFGIEDGVIYNGADDNASGVAGLLAIAQALAAEPPLHTTVFAIVDAEEMGFVGTYALLDDPRFPLDAVAFNLNLDMISKSAIGELYAAGGSGNPSVKALLDDLAALAPVTLLQGHDVADDPVRDDWTFESDHAPFHERNIPWLYLGVEDHPEYHQPTDDFATVPQDFFAGSVATAIAAFRLVDANLSTLAPPAQPGG